MPQLEFRPQLVEGARPPPFRSPLREGRASQRKLPACAPAHQDNALSQRPVGAAEKSADARRPARRRGRLRPSSATPARAPACRAQAASSSGSCAPGHSPSDPPQRNSLPPTRSLLRPAATMPRLRVASRPRPSSRAHRRAAFRPPDTRSTGKRSTGFAYKMPFAYKLGSLPINYE